MSEKMYRFLFKGCQLWCLIIAAMTLLHCASPTAGDDGGALGFGESCGASSECLGDLECVTLDALSGDRCSNPCEAGDDFTCPVGSRCVNTGSGYFCSGEGSGVGVPDLAGVGESCSTSEDCDGELRCFQPDVDNEEARICVETCDLDAPNCPAGQACVSINGEIGFCDFMEGGTSNGTTGTSNGTTGTSNGTTGTSNGTTGTSNGTTGTSNGTTGTSNGTTGTSNGTTGTSNRCETLDDACDAETTSNGEFVCVVADNNLAGLTCRESCVSDGDCASDAFCGSASTSAGVAQACLLSNCTSVLESLTECGGVMPDGGTCLPQAGDVNYCVAAGLRTVGTACTNERQCGAGLICSADVCAQPCSLASPVCGAGETCQESDAVAEVGVGVCRSPQRCERAGDSCQGPDEDSGALVCAASDPLNPQSLTCLQSCNPGACAFDAVCEVTNRSGEQLELCVSANCDSPYTPLDCQGASLNGGNCLPAQGSSVLRCVPAGAGSLGDVCARQGDCGAGLGCVMGGTCQPLCDVNNPLQCNAQQQCQPIVGTVGGCVEAECNCSLGQTCFQGLCVSESLCTIEGQPCAPGLSTDTAALMCIAGDSLNPTETTCHATCSPGLDDACASGSACVELLDDETMGVCLRSNCASLTDGVSECSSIGANGGHCLPSGNNSYRCYNAGIIPSGGACTLLDECVAGFGCLQGACSPFCATGDGSCVGDESCVSVFLDNDVEGICGTGCLGWEGGPGLCPVGQGCQPLSTDSGLCFDVGPRGEGDACNAQLTTESCGEFLSCADFGTSGATCQPWCNLTLSDADADATCNAEEICVEAYENLEEVLGLCWPSCNAWETESTNGCELEGFKSCLPYREGQSGICEPSGTVAPGEPCLRQESIFGDCQGGYACDSENPDAVVGTCERVCQTFAAQAGATTECTSGEVCGLFNEDWGVCTDNVLPGNLQEGSACSSPGAWCGEDSLCFSRSDVDPTDGICLQFCRLRPGATDCANSVFGTCSALLQSDALGVCF